MGRTGSLTGDARSHRHADAYLHVTSGKLPQWEGIEPQDVFACGVNASKVHHHRFELHWRGKTNAPGVRHGWNCPWIHEPHTDGHEHKGANGQYQRRPVTPYAPPPRTTWHPFYLALAARRGTRVTLSFHDSHNAARRGGGPDQAPLR